MIMGNTRMTSCLILCIVVMAMSVMSGPNKEILRSSSEEVEVIVPRDKQIVYDYQHGLVVYKFFDEDTEKFGPCYARKMQKKETYIPRAQTHPDEAEVLTEWRTTGRTVPDNMKSDTVKRMCRLLRDSDVLVYWLEEYEVDVVETIENTCTGWKIEFQCSFEGWNFQCKNVKICASFEFNWK